MDDRQKKRFVSALGEGLRAHGVMDGSAEVYRLKAKVLDLTRQLDKVYPLYHKANAQKHTWKSNARAWRAVAITWLLTAAVSWSALLWVLFLSGEG